MKILIASDDFNHSVKSRNLIGNIHSVFKNVVNFTIDKTMLTLGNSSISIGPKTAIVGQKINFIELGFKKDMAIEIIGAKIVVRDLELEFKYKPKEIWSSNPNFIYKKSNSDLLRKKVNYLGKMIFEDGDLDSISPIIFELKNDFIWINDIKDQPITFTNKNMHFIVSRFNHLIKAIETNSWDEIDELSKSVIGFGPGLTPASDDLILGLMIGLLYSHQDINKAIVRNKHFISLTEGKTTDVSYEALKNAVYGKVNIRIKEAIISILSNQTINEMKIKILKLFEIGQTSGTDVLTGIFIGIKLSMYKGDITNDCEL